MLSSRDYRVISTALTYFAANYDEVDRLQVFGTFHDLGKGKMPSKAELELLSSRIIKKMRIAEEQEM